MKNSLVHKIGIKAYSILLLKKNNLFNNKLLIITKFPTKNYFKEQIMQSKFNLEKGIFVRMSSKYTSIKLPKGKFYSIDKAYRFLKDNYKKGLTIIIHKHLKGKFGGTLTKYKGRLIMEFIKGNWNADYSINPDIIEFSRKGPILSSFYNRRRKTAIIKGEDIYHINIEPLNDIECKKIIKAMNKNLNKIYRILNKDDFNSIEFFIDSKYEFVPFELQCMRKLSYNLRKEGDILKKSFFEVKSVDDLKEWDGNGEILIDIECDIDRAEKLLKIIENLKGEVMKVYVKYGLLSHPSILLREAGLKVNKLTEGYITQRY